MCGIAGFWSPAGAPRNGSAILTRMTDAIVHRGPDAEGQWSDAEAGLFLGHRRLSILDLSPAGSQPMVSASGRFVITFNGEIYNFQELRTELEKRGVRFRGHSDTEVLVEGMECWGVAGTVRRAAGMFAFGVWDRQERTLTLGRDRIGEKPLYYGWNGRTFLFGSELKALRAHPDSRGDIDRNAVAVFLRHNYIPAPHSIYTHVRKLMPGHVAAVTADGKVTSTAYWSMSEAVARGASAPFAGTRDEAAAELRRVLMTTVREQMVSDVPLGAFLSGGVDSSLVVSLMQAQTARPVKTFTIKFDEPQYDESAHARAVADHLGTDHTEMTVTAADARDVIPTLPAMYDEPFSDSSQIPTALVSRVARSRVTVSLSGDGGDEFFGGYPRYPQTLALWSRLHVSPPIVRAAAAHALRAIPVRGWDRVLGGIPLSPSRRAVLRGDRIHKLAGILLHDSLEATYRRFVTHWPDPAQLVRGSVEAESALTQADQWPSTRDLLHRLMYLDSVTYLPDDIFVKVDRASMAVSLETRAPLVDHRVVEFAWTLPSPLTYQAGRGKLLLRRILDSFVPSSIVERPKMGFGIPLEQWLRGPLRAWGESLLAEKRLRAEGFFEPAAIREKWEQHQRGERRWHYLLWDVLMFQAWLEQQ